ncbi:MAG: SpoIID/LytB domain-containing protein [Chloroflexota bacterium]|nr:SpoIID/LytB domain-containing protein [Chloroflexota bacterium]
MLRVLAVVAMLAGTAGSANAALLSTLAATYGASPPATLGGGTVATVAVTVTNTGTETWDPAGVNPVRLSYHWYDAAGNVVAWDGLRTGLAGAVAPGASVSVNASVAAPAPGSLILRFALVKEGLAWLAPSQPYSVQVGAAYVERFAAIGPSSFIATTTSTLSVTVSNAGNVTWEAGGANPVHLAYHWHDASGNTVAWDGVRTVLTADVQSGASATLAATVVAPALPGSHTLTFDLVREGVAWFESLGNTPLRIAATVGSGFNAGYGATTTPAQIALGAVLQLQAEVSNYGQRTWPAGGTNPVHLSYHIASAAGATVVWDGSRGVLPADVAPGQTVNVTVSAQFPSTAGGYVFAWDLVQEGVAWFSSLGVPTKRETVNVAPGVTFHGKGNGHGVGMSQYGAQGWATGAAGPALSGEQIVAKYYTGTALQFIDGARGPIRVLLSTPSSSGSFTCGSPLMDTWLANVVSPGGFSVLNEGAGNARVGAAAPNAVWQIAARGGIVEVWNNSLATPVLAYKGAGPVVLVPGDPSQPITVREKSAWYRGNLKFTNTSNKLRLVDYANYDAYVQGVIPREMPLGWHIEAYKAQAYAARTYGYSSYAGAARDYDVRDDQMDQCYGGASVETSATNQAVAATAGKVITYNGTAIRAYFSSSSGGYTTASGCWLNIEQRPDGTVVCGATEPFLVPVADPADLAVSMPTTNKHASWTATFTGEQIRQAVLSVRGIDIGTLRSVDVSNQYPAGVGHVVSVRVTGTNATVDLRADTFLRGALGLRSTMVRLTPF